jgi:hypothetical protein
MCNSTQDKGRKMPCHAWNGANDAHQQQRQRSSAPTFCACRQHTCRACEHAGSCRQLAAFTPQTGLLPVPANFKTAPSHHSQTRSTPCHVLLYITNQRFPPLRLCLQMRQQRLAKQASAARDRPTAASLAAWAEMQRGSAAGQAFCLRFRLQPGSENGALRDPVAYRVILTPHYKTGECIEQGDPHTTLQDR